MKYSILSLALIAAPLFGFGQVRIDNAQNYTVGTHIRYQPCDATGIDAGFTGPNQKWDFSKMQPIHGIISEEIMKPQSTPYAGQFAPAGIAEKFSDGSYIFVDVEKLQSKMTGSVSADKNIANYGTPLVLAKRPIMFGGTNTYSFSDKYSAGGQDFYAIGKITFAADAYGTLVLPDGKKYKNVLRIKITQKEADHSSQTKNISEKTIVTYAWYDQIHKAPLLTVRTVTSQNVKTTTANYLLSEVDK